MATMLGLAGAKGTRVVAGVLQVFVGLCGVGGGLALVAAPDGALLGLSTAGLSALPVDDFVVPGVLLLLLVGVGSLVAATATFRGWPRSGELAIAGGLILLAWVCGQVVLLGSSSGLATSFFALGLLEILQGVLLRRTARDAAARAGRDGEVGDI